MSDFSYKKYHKSACKKYSKELYTIQKLTIGSELGLAVSCGECFNNITDYVEKCIDSKLAKDIGDHFKISPLSPIARFYFTYKY